MTATARTLTPQELSNDIGHIGEFLRAIEGVLPGYTVAELLGFLDSAKTNPLPLQLLTNALNQPQPNAPEVQRVWR